MAQMNAAYLLDKGLGSELLCRNCTAKERRRAALQYSLILYRRAAKQGNVNANLKVRLKKQSKNFPVSTLLISRLFFTDFSVCIFRFICGRRSQ